MNNRCNRYKILGWLSFFAVSLVALAAVILSGCADTLEGDINENLNPVVYFVNIPPEDFSFSHNPEVYWFGSDPDGQIDYYRYLVATAETVQSDQSDAALAYAATQDDSAWTYVDVDPLQSDPQTAHVIPLTADMLDPVRTYVTQFIFVQAFDNEGAGSNIACRRFSRNDHPPATRIWNVANDTPFVNSAVPGGIITGVNIRWEGSDERDYDEQGLVAPPFEYEWRLYGPYTDDSLQYIYDNFVETVFVTPEAVIYHFGDTLIVCDSVLIDTVEEPYWEKTCDTIEFGPDDASSSTVHYRVDTLLDINNDYFARNLVTRSDDGIDEWVFDTQDTIYNVFAGYEDEGLTIQRKFIFWCRCRDDALVADPTPAFTWFPTINPRHERDVLVFDMSSGQIPIGAVRLDLANLHVRKGYFKDMLETWNPSITFDTAGYWGDYLQRADYDLMPQVGRSRLRKLLSYKVLVIYEDAMYGSGFNSGSNIGANYVDVLTAIDAGINCWITARGFLFGNYADWERYPPVPPEMGYYFGVDGVFFAGWGAYMRIGAGPVPSVTVRIEDFIGAYSIDPEVWPDLAVDTALLHARYQLDTLFTANFVCYWIDSIASLPEVDWCERRYGTEVMYLYKSLYGPNHFLGWPYAIEGTPVAHRYETNLFRTAWFMFTPLAIEAGPMQELANEVMDWLYDPTLGAAKPTVVEERYPGAAVKISVDEARENYDQRLSER
ncbi:MAG: hypothetical protein JSW34_09390 [Candidatus Zixiibacteriota bacterium]|nr:MAG: hypothetical protein JSW34_09390 [candidate division Zixibacteria bacterium]